MSVLEVRDLSIQFGGIKALQNVQLRAGEWEIVGIIGPNGAGKTTLFNCITGFYTPDHGSIRYRDRDVTRLPVHERTALGMGRTFQISNVIAELTCLENLTLAAVGIDRRKWVLHRPVTAFADLRDRARAGLELVGLGPRADELVRRLSYGERRQLELALAVTSRPRVLFLDEPCAGLSPSERTRISKLIADLPRDLTLLMIEHDMDVALGLADRVTVLHQGRVILEGAPGEVQTNAEVREVYFGHG
jgi:branched-chain amino acid transport system ATP-binding protein